MTNYLFFFYVLDFSLGFIYTRLAFFSFFFKLWKGNNEYTQLNYQLIHFTVLNDHIVRVAYILAQV